MAAYMARAGWTLRSGHARGADQAFEMGALSERGPMEIYLPWTGFNGTRADGKRYIVPADTPEILSSVSEEARELAKKHHPAWYRCSTEARLLHIRNGFQVLGRDLRTPSRFIICWTRGGKGEGGTGQAIRIARAHNIPVYDLGSMSVDQVWDEIN